MQKIEKQSKTQPQLEETKAVAEVKCWHPVRQSSHPSSSVSSAICTERALRFEPLYLAIISLMREANNQDI